MIIPLNEMKINENGIITSCPGEQMAVRGFLRGEGVKVCMVSPLGDPIAVRMGDCVWALRLSEARKIMVETNGNTRNS